MFGKIWLFRARHHIKEASSGNSNASIESGMRKLVGKGTEFVEKGLVRRFVTLFALHNRENFLCPMRVKFPISTNKGIPPSIPMALLDQAYES